MPRSLAAERWDTPRSCRSRERHLEKSELIIHLSIKKQCVIVYLDEYKK